MRGGFPWGIGRRLAGVRANKSCMELTIREERPDDCRTVGELVEAAFRPLAFSDHTEHLLVARLRRSEAFVPGLSLVAEAEGRLVGHVLLTRLEVVAEDRVPRPCWASFRCRCFPGCKTAASGRHCCAKRTGGPSVRGSGRRCWWAMRTITRVSAMFPRAVLASVSRSMRPMPAAWRRNWFRAASGACTARSAIRPRSSGRRRKHDGSGCPAAENRGGAPCGAPLPFPESGVPPDLLHGLFCGNPAVGIYSTTLRTGRLPTPQSGHTNPRESPRKRFRERCLRRDRLLPGS